MRRYFSIQIRELQGIGLPPPNEVDASDVLRHAVRDLRKSQEEIRPYMPK
jgi:hypothetical protein